MNLWQGLAQRREHWRTTRSGGLDVLQPTSPRQRVLRTLATYLAVVTLCSILDLRGFNYSEQYAQYVRQGVYERRNVSLAEKARKRIVLVSISDDTFHRLPGPPLPRDYQAKVVRDLTRAGAKVIAFDLVFDLPGPQDKPFIAAARASQRVLWACLMEDQGTPQQREIDPIPSLFAASPYKGHILMPQESDIMTVDSTEPVLIHKGKMVPSFSLEAALMALGLQHQELQRTPGAWRVGNLTVPVDAKGRSKIGYLGRPGEVFPVIPYEQLYQGAVDEPFFRDNHFFRDKIVLIGDVTTVGDDHRFTPLGDMSGMEIHAHAIATFLQRGFMTELPQWANTGAILLLSALALPALLRLPVRSAMFASLLLLTGFFALDLWLFADYRILLHMVGPSVALGLVTVSVLAERSVLEERDKNRMEGLLRRHVSPQIASYMLAHPEKCTLGRGEQIVASVMFCDIRGFTALSETLQPEQMIAYLNEYFQVMTDAIFKHEGTVDKFMGDAVMAIFGAPVPHADHAQRAVFAAIDMQNALLELQTEWRSQRHSAFEHPIFEVGIGINTGPMVVGNIGARERLDFTAIGDTVNLASRVESLTKKLHCRILITQSTYDCVQGQVETRGPIHTKVIGRQEGAVVYELCGGRDAP